MTISEVFIVGRGCLTAAGADFNANWRGLIRGVPALKTDPIFGMAGRLHEGAESFLQKSIKQSKRLRRADRAVQLGVLAAREAWAESQLEPGRLCATIIGSSRGATQTIEQEHGRFLERGCTSVQTSPATTAGSLASVVAQELGVNGPVMSVSSACATGLVAIGTAFGLLKAGLAVQALAGGSEASLTAFTRAQLHAVSVLDPSPSMLFPLRPMHPERNGMVAGEGAACVAIATHEALREQRQVIPLARIAGYGAASESTSATGISPTGEVLIQAVRRAIAYAQIDLSDIDLIVGHGAGTRQGDDAEIRAYDTLFGHKHRPPLTLHKWLTGHMLGASAAHSAALATAHLMTGQVPALPYWDEVDDRVFEPRYALITALGFGGIAAALILARD